MSMANWAPYTNYMQSGIADGSYVSGAFTVVAAGPPRLANMGANLYEVLEKGNAGADALVYPIGILQNFSVSHQRTFQRFWELGSERSFFVAGRSVGQIQLGRIYYHGASLLRLLYAYYYDSPKGAAPHIPSMFADPNYTLSNPHDVIIPPGYENVFVNLASDMFAQPIGLLFYMRDLDLRSVSAVYFEACYVPTHGLSTDAAGVVVQEQAALQFERAIPVKVADTVQLITSSNAPDAGNSWITGAAA